MNRWKALAVLMSQFIGVTIRLYRVEAFLILSAAGPTTSRVSERS